MPAIGTGVSTAKGGQSLSSYWATLISATVEDVTPTNIVLTFSYYRNIVATDLSCSVNGFNLAISSVSWTGSVLTVVLFARVYYGDSIILTFKTGQTKPITNNIAIESETTALVARMTAASETPVDSRIRLINKAFTVAKPRTYYGKLDMLVVLASHGSGANGKAARMNWLADMYNLTDGTAPIFTVDRGHKGNGSSMYLKTGLVLSTPGLKYALNSASIITYVRTEIAENTYLYGVLDNATNGKITTSIPRAADGKIYPRINSTNTPTAQSVVSSIGLHIETRNVATEIIHYRDRNKFIFLSDSVAVPVTHESYLFGRNNYGTLNLPTNHQVALHGYGSGFDDTDVAEFNEDFVDGYLMPIGAAPYNPKWNGAEIGAAYTQLADITTVNVFTPSDANNNAYNHAPHLWKIGSRIWLFFTTHDTDEDKQGQYIRCTYSDDNGDTWSAINTAVPSLYAMSAAADQVARIFGPIAHISLEGKYYLISTGLEVTWVANNIMSVTGVGYLSTEFDPTTGVFQTSKWIHKLVADTNYDVADNAAAQMDELLQAGKIYGSMQGISDVWPLNEEAGIEEHMIEGVAFRHNDVWVRLSRGYTGGYTDTFMYSQRSNDGITWDHPYKTEIPNSPSGIAHLTHSSGKQVIFFNPKNDTYVRDPLAVGISSDGYNWDAYKLITTNDDTPVYAGVYKIGGASYPHAIELSNGEILVAYSLQKEKISVSRFALP